MITILCCALVLLNVACGSADAGDAGEELKPCPTDYEFQPNDNEHFEDDVFVLERMDDGVCIRSKYCLNDVCITTQDDVFVLDYLVAGYEQVVSCDVVDIENITFADTFECDIAKYKRVGQVSYRLYEEGDYIFCSGDTVIERCYVEEPCVYRLTKDSGAVTIYEVNNNE